MLGNGPDTSGRCPARQKMTTIDFHEHLRYYGSAQTKIVLSMVGRLWHAMDEQEERGGAPLELDAYLQWVRCVRSVPYERMLSDRGTNHGYTTRASSGRTLPR